MTSRRIVVTGASSGIGQATARLFAANGWQVVGVARRKDRLDALAAEAGMGGNMETFVCDVTDAASVLELRDYLASSGPIHALVNNAGGAFGASSVEESDPADWQRMFDVNVLGLQRVTAALLPLLRAGIGVGPVTTNHADIVNLTSTAGTVWYEGGGGYNAAKAAAHAVTGVLRLELAGEPIRVIEVAPGMVKTDEFALNRMGGDTEKAGAVYKGVDHPLTAEDVAATIFAALSLPGHVNLDTVVVRPVAQAAQHKVVREPLKPKP